MHTFKRSAALAIAALAIAGCSGKTGTAGANGANGSTGPQGPAGPVTTTNESCMVCHATDRMAPVEPNHRLKFAASGAQDDIDLAINAVSVASVSGTNKVAVTFTPTLHSNGTAVTGLVGTTVDLFRFYMAVQDPTSTFLNRTAYERNAIAFGTTAYPYGTLADNGDGTYTYTSAIDAPATGKQRIYIRVSGAGVNTGNASYDYDAAVGTTRLTTPLRDIVPSATCNKCHVERIADHGHGGGYNVAEGCVVCHSPLLDETGLTATPHDMQAWGYDFPTLVHQIHGHVNHTTLPGTNPATPGKDWSAVTYPARLYDCKVCHTGGALSDNYKNRPTALACESCHTFVRFSDQGGYGGTNATCGDPAWVYPNLCNHPNSIASTSTACSGCHSSTLIDGYHDTTYNASHPYGTQKMVNVPEFHVSLTITPPGNGSYYVAGETPTVTATLTTLGGAAVPTSFYTSAKHATGTTSATSLSNARLYVYGPRTTPVPVLTAGAAITPVATQSTQLFASPTPTDTSILTDATGFKYKLKPIPTLATASAPGFAPGTYFVRFYATNYGYVTDTNYSTDSNAMLKIQIGTATEQAKVAGDACVSCHGTGTATFHDARHNVVFDTDACDSCHDLSGNHADALSNRVHAVHASSVTGDILALTWADVAYPVSYRSGSGILNAVPPGATMRCSVCHTSGNAQFQANVGEVSCMGCHADAPGATDHFRQNGGKY